MATLATFVNRFVGVRELADVSPAVWTRTESPRLRPIANEDVYLFVKRIDNTAVVRAADPAASLARSRSMLTGFVAAMLVIAGLVPTAYNTTAGFTLQQLRGEQVQLQQQMTKLNAAEARLVSLDRLQRLAKTLKMSRPAPQQVETLDGRPVKTEARNALPFNADRVAR
jgi:cell division protein FtsL